MELNTKASQTAGAGLAPAVWGSTYLVTTELLPPGRPLLDGVLRALPAGLLLLTVSRVAPSGCWWWRSLVLGALNIGALLGLLFVAAERLPGGIAATLISLQPLLVAALALPLLGERLSARRIVAGLGGVVGVGLLVLRADASLDRRARGHARQPHAPLDRGDADRVRPGLRRRLGDFTTSDFDEVMGRPPRPFADFARHHAQAFTRPGLTGSAPD